jgi:hypothetical protein
MRNIVLADAICPRLARLHRAGSWNAARPNAVDQEAPMFPAFFILLCLAVLMVVMVPTARHRPWRDEGDSKLPPRNRAFDVLNQCLAKGGIDRSEFDEKPRTIAQGRWPGKEFSR